MQIRVVARQTARHRHRLRVMGVYPPCAGIGQLRQFVGVGAFEFGQRAVFQNFGGQRVILGEFFQHLFVSASGPCGCFFDDGQAEFVKEDFAELFG